ncbi:hypothetical protein M1D89_17540 [Arthrobacter sp. D3-18]
MLGATHTTQPSDTAPSPAGRTLYPAAHPTIAGTAPSTAERTISRAAHHTIAGTAPFRTIRTSGYRGNRRQQVRATHHDSAK